MWKWYEVNWPVVLFFCWCFVFLPFTHVWRVQLCHMNNLLITTFIVLLHGGTIVLALSRELIKALISENCKLPDWSNSISSKALESASQSITSGCPGLLPFSLQYLNSKNHLFHCFWKYYFCAAVWTYVLLEGHAEPIREYLHELLLFNFTQ